MGAPSTQVYRFRYSVADVGLRSSCSLVVQDEELTKWFLSHGAYPNAQAQILDVTPLSLAVKGASFNVIKNLFNHGGSDSIKHGQLLHYAAQRSASDDLEVMQYILDKNPVLNEVMYQNDISNSYGFQKVFFALGTALHVVAERGKFEPIELLLAKGIDPSIRDCRGKLAMDVAMENGHDAIAAYLRPLSQGAHQRVCFTDQPWARDCKFPIDTSPV